MKKEIYMSDNLLKSHRTWLRILMVENDASRDKAFNSWLADDTDTRLSRTPTGNIAISMLQRDPPDAWAGIMLDYDLDEFSKAVPYKCGWDVALAMARHTDKATPILVHSMNPGGSAQVSEYLRSSGFTAVTKTPFADMTETKFLDWLSTCREIAIERIEELEEE